MKLFHKSGAGLLRGAFAFTMFVAAAAMMFASCNKENDDPTPVGDQLSEQERLIVGQWNETEILYIYTQGGVCDTTPMLEEGETAVITFRADKTYTTVYHSTDGDSEDEGTWSASGSTITIADEFGPSTYTIDRLDSEVFNITYNDEGSDEDGPYTLSIVIRMTRM